MHYTRMPIEIEAPEEKGYNTIRYNLADSSMRDIIMGDLDINFKELVLFYGEHRGVLKLRQAIIEDSKVLTPDDVLVTAGAATALFIVATTILSPHDHLVVIRPNYGTNLETPRAINCQMTVIDLSFETGFEIDIEAVNSAIRPETKLISITNPHNPTGKLYSQETIHALTSLAERNNCHLLVDETYRDLNFQTPLIPYVAELSDQVISVSSVSKSFGAPGIRIGWIISRDRKLINDFLAAKEQISLCNSVVDEEIAWYLLHNKQRFILPNHAQIRTNFAYMKHWFESQPYLEWVEPQAGVVCFPRLKASYTIDTIDTEKLYAMLYDRFATIVGPGHWFERDRTNMRIGFGYPTLEELKAGLHSLEVCLTELAIMK
jgi:aspartate/methionine/tyrosine aminotransferase